MSFTKKQLVLKKMINNGNNPKESKADVIKYYDSAVRCYEGATVKQLADIIKVFAIND